MLKTEELQKMARDLRRHAGETDMPAYERMMLQAASDLEALAEGGDIQFLSEPVRRVANS